MAENVKSILGDRYILAVEDSLVQAKRLEHFFVKNNLNYNLFPNAEEAFQFAKSYPPGLLISDVIMPGMDGYEFCKEFKAIPYLADIPVILLTSLQDSQDIIKGLQAGANNFISKPYDEKYLLQRIDNLLSNQFISSSENSSGGLDLKFRGDMFHITSGKKQILDLLLSVYETAMQRNDELASTKSQLEKSNEDLIQANSDLESFSRTVSHDLKSPLSVIIGFASIILDKPDSEIGKEERTYVKHILDSANEMTQLVKDLLAFAQSGKVDIKEEDIDLSSMANELIESLLLRYPETRFKIEIEPGMHTKADQKMVHVVLDNLLGNALKYSSKSESPVVVFGQKDYYGSTLFFIKDNGVGFDAANADKLFQPFVRYHSGGEFSGTGVGLSTVKRIIDKHKGQIWAESEIGSGSVFNFTLN